MQYSQMSKLLTCPRSYQHAELDKLLPLTSRTAATFGHAWHSLLYKYAKDPAWFKDLDAGVDGVLDLLQWVDPLDDYRNREKLKRGLRAYLERYADTPYQFLDAEISYKHLIVPGLEPQEGRVDALVLWDANHGMGREHWLVDYKTTSMLRSDWVEFYRNSNQFRYYLLAMAGRYPDLAGVVVDVYHATKGVQKGKTPEERDGNRFYRLAIRYEDFQLQEAKHDYGVAIVTKQVYLDAGYFPKNTSACIQYGSACPFLELCDSASEESRDRIKSTYAENTFDPHAPLEV